MLFISKKSLILCFLVTILVSFLACSAPTSEVNKATKKLSCTASDCDEVTMSIIIPSGFSTLDDGKYYFVGTQNHPNSWEIYSALEDSNGNSVKDRDIRVHIDSYPKELDLSGQDSSKISISWTPLNTYDEGNSETKMKIYIRDVDRCKHDNPSKEKECENLKKRMAQYEQSQTARFYITEDEDLEAVAEKLNFMSTKQTQDVSGALMKGCLMGMGAGVLTGFLAGGTAIGMIAGGLSGCMNTANTVNNTINSK